ncbi:hypothetical protein B5X24_HaOG211208 [Helicoverpa armigera]|nr:hypothetical protein B5X24_HaOG211208 [Helicoverpa armigera]
MPLTTVIYTRAIESISKRGQHAVSAPPHPPHQRRASLAHNSVEAIHTSNRKHTRCATVAWKPQQHPKRVIELNTKGTVRFLRVVGPQSAGVQRGTVCSEKSYLNLR